MSQRPLLPQFTFPTSTSSNVPSGLPSFSTSTPLIIQTSHLSQSPILPYFNTRQSQSHQQQPSSSNAIASTASTATTTQFTQHFSSVQPQRSQFIASSSNTTIRSGSSSSAQGQLNLMDVQERPDGLETSNLKNSSEFQSYIECFADKDTYFCQICHNLLWQPISCQNCSKIYCKECIGYWVESQSSCPTCRERFHAKKIDKSILNNLNKLVFACSASATGCTEFIAYNNLLKHQNACAFKKVSCTNTGCDYSSIRQVMNQTLPYDTLILMLQDMPLHSNTCEHGMLGCKWCSRQIKRMNSVQHEEICEMKILGCENQGCSASLTRAEMNVHISECPFNIVRCDMCSQDFNLKDINSHKQNCDYVVTSCRGCHASMFKKHITSHEEVCDDVELPCLECTHVILRKNLRSHDQISCLKSGQRILLESKTRLQCENACLKRDVETMNQCIAQLYEQVQELVASRRTSMPKTQRIDSIQK